MDPRSDTEPSVHGRARLEEASLAAARIAHHYYFAHEAVALMAASLLSINLAERALADDQLTRPYAQIGYFSGIAGFRTRSKVYFARARRNAEAANDPTELSIALYHEATFHVGEGEWELSRTIATRALDLLGAIENQQESEIVHTVMAHAEYCLGRYEDSVARCRRVSDSARARANVQHEAWGLYAGARSLIRLGRVTDARAHLDRALSLLVRRPEPPSELISFSLRALANLRDGYLADAERDADQALERIERRSSPMIFSVGDAYAAVADVYLTLWERSGVTVRRGSAPLSRRASLAFGALRRFARVFPIGRPALLLTSGRLARLKGDERAAEERFDRAAEIAAALAMPYEQATAKWLLGDLPGGRTAGRRALREAARRDFERLGCTADVLRTRESGDV